MNEKKKSSPLQILSNLDWYFAVVLLVALLVITAVGVLRRYIMRTPFIWLEEVQGLLFMWITFIGGSAAFRKGSHVSVEILVDSLPKKVGAVIERFDVLLQLIILGYVASQAFAYYMQLVNTNKVTSLLRIPFKYAYIVIPVGAVLMIISMLWGSYMRFVKGVNLKGGDEE
ncbi:MAG: TRAP transporter small permease [Clostridia bacterium]|nr:TRAP transporter small permease [Clostridia bacterium]